MERIKVKINKLGRVVDSIIEIAPLMVFSGESGMGKSYLAMLAHYFYDVLMISDKNSRLSHLFDNLHYDYKEMAKSFHNEGEALTITKRDIETWMEKDAINYLRFMFNSDELNGIIKITLPNTIPDNIVIKFKEEYTGLVNNEDVDIVLSINNIGYRASHSAINDITPYAALLAAYLTSCLFGDINALQSTFNMPPSRGPILSEEVKANSGMYKDFITDINELGNVQANPKITSEPLLKQLFSIMEGEVKKENNRLMYHTNGVSMPISAAAASIREIAPLQMLASKLDVSKTAILIEEPEAHLHPSKQRMMADVVGCIRNAGSHVHLTTHSDYFLQRMNELIMFQKYVDSHNPEEISQLKEKTGIKTSFGIKVDDLVSYIVLRQKDESSKAFLQDMSNGIPFASFRDAIKDSMHVRDILEDALYI